MASDLVLKLAALSKEFPSKDRWPRKGEPVRAVADVTLTLRRGETLGLVGESGCGKSTLAKTIVGLLEPTAGKVVYHGKDLTTSGGAVEREARRGMQIVFQDPFSSLAPMTTVGASISEPLVANAIGTRESRSARVRDLLTLVGLHPSYANRYPQEFSGGQLQRIALARALAPSPDVIILDEATSSLDVSVKAQMADLLLRIQEETSVAYLFISHDIATVRHLSHRIAVMYLGRVVEVGDAEEVHARPRHPYTKALLDAVPIPDPVIQRTRARNLLTGDVPSPDAIPSGCAFRTRCPLVHDRCAEERPELLHVEEGLRVACHLYPRSMAEGTDKRPPKSGGSE